MDIRPEYKRLLTGTNEDSLKPNIHFYVYSTSLEEGRGDVFVALGLARALDALGWGVSFADRHQWQQKAPDTTTVTMSMLPTADARSAPSSAIRIGWARNSIREWAAQDSINYFDGMFVSSADGLNCLSEAYSGPSEVMPIAVDPDLFFSDESDRTTPIVTTVNYWNQDRGLISDLKQIDPPAEIYWYGKNLRGIEMKSDRVIVREPVNYLDIPAIYRDSRLVLDDLTIASREHGCHNSRLFEGLASGALVITNEQRGLAELGLSETPVFADLQSLKAVLEDLMTDEAERERLVATLRRKVLDHHTFGHRAGQVAGFVSSVQRTYLSRRELIDAHQELIEAMLLVATQNDELRQGLTEAQEEIERFRNRLAVRVADRFRTRVHRSK